MKVLGQGQAAAELIKRAAAALLFISHEVKKVIFLTDIFLNLEIKGPSKKGRKSLQGDPVKVKLYK